MSRDTNTTDVEPWYRQFWPWFLIALPGCVVIASLHLVNIAFKYADQPVKDNYYKEGRAINRRLAEDQAAAQLGLTAAIQLDQLTGQILLQLDGRPDPAPAELALAFIHPVAAERDFNLTLRHAGGDRYVAELPRSPRGHWHLHLSGDAPEPWRLRRRIDLDQSTDFRIEP